MISVVDLPLPNDLLKWQQALLNSALIQTVLSHCHSDSALFSIVMVELAILRNICKLL